MSPVSYFAYGANMSARVLARRKIQPSRTEVAWLDGYRLTFSHPGLPLIEPVFASVEPAPGSRVYGVLYQISPRDLEWLDHVESRYQKINLDVTGSRSGITSARVYQTRTPIRGKRPSLRYLRLLIDGAKENKLPPEYIAQLEAQPSFSIPVYSWVMGRLINQRDRVMRLLRREEP